MELVALLLFVIGIAATLVVAKRGAERARQEREQRWSRMPAVARPGLPLSGSARSLAVAGRPAAPSPSHVPEEASSRVAEEASPPAGPSPGASSRAPASRPTPAPAPRTRVMAPPIDVNAATVEELSTLPGVGVRAAERIVAHRERHGPFRSLDALEAVEGFDHHRVARLARRATVRS